MKNSLIDVIIDVEHLRRNVLDGNDPDIKIKIDECLSQQKEIRKLKEYDTKLWGNPLNL